MKLLLRDKLQRFILVNSLIFCLYASIEQQNLIEYKLFFLLINALSGLLTGIVISVGISKIHRISCVSFSRIDSSLCINYVSAWSNFNILHNSQGIIFPNLSWIDVSLFFAKLLHSLLWLTVSSLSPHNLLLHFFRELSIFLWHNWFLRQYFVRQLKEKQFHFSAMCYFLSL